VVSVAKIGCGHHWVRECGAGGGMSFLSLWVRKWVWVEQPGVVMLGVGVHEMGDGTGSSWSSCMREQDIVVVVRVSRGGCIELI
jgi:hypothetical protein